MKLFNFGRERENTSEQENYFDLEKQIAGLVVADTVYFTCNLMYPDVPQEEILGDFLDEKTSEKAAMGLRAQYLGDKEMARKLKIEPRSDLRVREILLTDVTHRGINTHTGVLGRLIREEVTHYLSLSEDARWNYVKPKVPQGWIRNG